MDSTTVHCKDYKNSCGQAKIAEMRSCGKIATALSEKKFELSVIDY
jgi:hypothetical protein